MDRDKLIDRIAEKMVRADATLSQLELMRLAVHDAPDDVLELLAMDETSLTVDKIGMVRIFDADGQLLGQYQLPESS